MSGDDASDRFASTEVYYAEHRPDYGEAAIAHLVERFSLDDSHRVLDLGCGAGQIAVPLAADVGEVVGMDPNERMLDHARERATAAGLENCEWVVGSDADLDELSGPFRLVTMGRSFHWTDQHRTLEHVHRLTGRGGGVALLGDPEWLTRGTADWQDEVYALATEYVTDLPERTGPVEYEDPWDELLAATGFIDVDLTEFDVEREWTVDGVVGYVFSLSYCSPDAVGDAAAFEADLRERLADFDAERFRQDATVWVISGKSDRGGRATDE